MPGTDPPSHPYEILAKQAQESATRYQGVADKLRGRVSAWGGSIQTVGLAAVGWIGFDKLVDIFPFSDGMGGLLALLIIGAFGSMAYYAISLGRELTYQNRPLAMSINIEDVDSLKPDEESKVFAIYKQFAELNGYKFGPQVGDDQARRDGSTYPDNIRGVSTALRDYFAKASYYERIAEKAYELDSNGNAELVSPDQDKANRISIGLARSAQIRAELMSVQARACVVVIRGRVNKATTGPRSRAALAGFATALVCAWFLSDAAAAVRSADSDQLALAKACGETRKSLTEGGATTTVPEDCNAASGSGSGGDPTQGEIATANLVALSAQFATCQANATVKDAAATVENLKGCAPLRADIDAQLKLIK